MEESYSLRVKNNVSKAIYYEETEKTMGHAIVRLKYLGREIASNYADPDDFEWAILNWEAGSEEGELMAVRGTFDKKGNPSEIRIFEAR